MDYGNLISESYVYTKDGLLGNVGTWVLLLILTLIPAIPMIGLVLFMVVTMGTTPDSAPDLLFLAGGFGIAILLAVILSAFYTGYTLKILRGEKPLPPVSGFSILFVDGIKYLIIQMIYMIPAIIVFCLTVVPAMLAIMTSAIAGEPPATGYGAMWGMMGGILLTTIIAFILGLIALIGVVRFARTGSMGEAFNFSEILATIGKIGWGTYIIALIIMMVVVLAVTIVLSIIPIIGGIIQFIIGPPVGIFTMRYICLLYDSAGTA